MMGSRAVAAAVDFVSRNRHRGALDVEPLPTAPPLLHNNNNNNSSRRLKLRGTQDNFSSRLFQQPSKLSTRFCEIRIV